MTATEITIRASTLPAYHDCARRAMARSMRRSIEAMGFQLRHSGTSIGAAIGTGAHAGAAHLLVAKRDGREYREPDAAEIAIDTLRSETAQGEIVWDTRTNNRNAAEQQVVRMTGVFFYQVLPGCQPRTVEVSRRALISPAVYLQGRSDLETTDEALRDLKFGSVPSFYLGQFGGYSLLRRTHGLCLPSRLVLHHIPRVRIDKPQPAAAEVVYDPVVAEQAAWATINAIIKDWRAFEESADPWQIPANPMSNLCSEKYCSAWGTPFCTLKGPRND